MSSENENPVKLWRLLNRDGSFNVMRPRHNRIDRRDLYHSLLSISNRKFFMVLVGYYLVLNFFFASLYFICGPNALEGVPNHSIVAHFSSCFFFSVQTLATIGYGKISPVSFLANIIVAVEALVGLLGLATVTGLFFARFSKAQAKVLFSDKLIVNTIDGVPSLIFRVGNERLNQIADANVNVTLSISETTKEGETYRNLYDLELERKNTPIFLISLTVVHPITKTSPLYPYLVDTVSHDHLHNASPEIFVTLSGTDESLGQNVRARYSYSFDEIIWDRTFVDILHRNKQGLLEVDMDKISLLN